MRLVYTVGQSIAEIGWALGGVQTIAPKLLPSVVPRGGL